MVCSLRSTQGDQGSVSLDCAASLARTALTWLQPEAVQGLIRLCGRARPGDEMAAEAALCALSAALRLLWAATQHPGLASAQICCFLKGMCSDVAASNGACMQLHRCTVHAGWQQYSQGGWCSAH
jgi:hypothetical protein